MGPPVFTDVANANDADCITDDAIENNVGAKPVDADRAIHLAHNSIGEWKLDQPIKGAYELRQIRICPRLAEFFAAINKHQTDITLGLGGELQLHASGS